MNIIHHPSSIMTRKMTSKTLRSRNPTNVSIRYVLLIFILLILLIVLKQIYS